VENKDLQNASNDLDSIIADLLKAGSKQGDSPEESLEESEFAAKFDAKFEAVKPAFELELEKALAAAFGEESPSEDIDEIGLEEKHKNRLPVSPPAFEDTIEYDENEGEGFADIPIILQPPRVMEFEYKRPLWPPIICALVVFILLTGGITYYNKTTALEHAAEQALIQQQGDVLLDESIALIQEADSVIVALDKATEEQMTKEGIPRLEALLDQLENVQASLDSAIEKAGDAKAIYVDKSRRELAEHAEQAARHRKEMLDLSSQLAQYDIIAIKSALLVDEAWTLIVDADAEMRYAVETVNEGGADAVQESRDYNQSAVEKLGQAGDKLAEATAIFSGLDLSPLANYLVAKKASAELALASDQAFLDELYWDADTLNDEFIAKDAEAVELAAQIPPNHLTPVVSHYDAVTKQLREDYLVARSLAADADVFLRDYLGVDVLDDGADEKEQNTADGTAVAAG
jgi:hypothetical protein